MSDFCNADKNYEWFKENLHELVKSYDNQYVVIKNENILGVYPSFDDAFNETVKNERPGSFLIQLCSLDETKTGQTFFTHRVSFA